MDWSIKDIGYIALCREAGIGIHYFEMHFIAFIYIGQCVNLSYLPRDGIAIGGGVGAAVGLGLGVGFGGIGQDSWTSFISPGSVD